MYSQMIHGNKISQTELLVTRRNQRFADYVFSLRKQRQQRFLSHNIGRPQKSIYVPRLYEKSVEDNALRYKYRVNVGNRAFFHQHQLPSHCFSPTQQYLDKHLKQSRIISEQSNKQIQFESRFQQTSRRWVQTINDSQVKRTKMNSGRIIWGRKSIKDTVKQQNQEYQSNKQQTVSSRYSFNNQRQIKSQYFYNKHYNDVSIQRSQLTPKYNGFHSSRSLINGFESMPQISQNPELYHRKIHVKKQPGKLYKKAAQSDMLDELLQQQPLKMKL